VPYWVEAEMPQLLRSPVLSLHTAANKSINLFMALMSLTTMSMRFCLVSGLVVKLGVDILLNPVSAQIIPDATLGSEGSRFIEGVEIDRIEGGAARGVNLFHSFTEFNVLDGQQVYFANPGGIETILSRVTGGNGSDIFGTLGVLGNANLFLVNPNGIVFGPNARLDVAGSFVASTGNGFDFSDGSSFSATNPEAPPLLTINVTPGLQRGTQPLGEINNAGNLAVGSGQTLALYGGDVTSTGSLSAPGGTVMMLGDRIGLLDNARINVSSQTGGGTVLIGGGLQGKGAVPNATRTFVDAGVQIEADALTTGDGGTVIVWADQVTGFYGTISARGGSDGGNGGFVEVSGKEHLVFRGGVDTSASQGNPGTLLLDPENITIVNGDGSADDIQLNDSQILQGDGGASSFTISENTLENLSGNTNVILQATNNITINNLNDNELKFQDGTGGITFIADADKNGVGSFLMQDTQDTIYTNGRNIEISGASLTLGNIYTFSSIEGSIKDNDPKVVNIDKGGSIADATFDSDTFTTIPQETQFDFNVSEQGSISDLNVRFSAKHTWDGDLSVSLKSPGGTQLNLFSGVGGDGDNFQDTLLDDEATTSINQGTAPFMDSFRPDGSLAIFDGQNPNGKWTLTVTDNAVGDRGTLFKAGDSAFGGTVQGTQLVFKLVPTQSDNTVKNSGSIELNATNGNISVGKLNTANGFGAGGNITLDATGNITIANNNTTDGFITDFLSSHSSSSNGGNIALTADGSINLTNSSINSTSRNGKAGNVAIESRSIDLSQSAIQLVNTTIDAAAFNSKGRTGNVTIDAANGGSVQLVGVSQQPRIHTDTFGEGGNLTISGGSVTIDNYELIADVNSGASGKGGNILIKTPDHGNVSITNNAVISTTTRGQGNAGNITINTGRLILSDSAKISTSSLREGEGGNIKIDASESVELQGSTENLQNDVLIPALTGKGSLDNLLNNPNVMGLLAGSQSNGKAGSITIETEQLTAQNGALISTTVFGEGDGGDITIDASQKVELTNSSLISATLNADNQGGKSGDIRVNTPEFILRDGATVLSTTTSTGQGGDIIIKEARSVELGSAPSDATIPTSLITSSIIGSGESGNIEINTQRLLIQDRAGLFSTSGSRLLRDQLDEERSNKGGVAGDISITATDSVELFGQTQSDRFRSGISSATFTSNQAGNVTINTQNLSLQGITQVSAEATNGGNAGGVSIKTEQLSIEDGAQVTVSSRQGQAGNLDITANSLLLDQGKIRAETGSSDNQTGAEITLTLRDWLRLENESLISAEAFGDANGGNVKINLTTNRGFLFALPSNSNGSDIIAQANQGTGGNITITAPLGIYGIEERKANPGNRTNDIDASSEFGAPGQITINSLVIDPSQGLIELPTDTAAPQLDQTCSPTGSGKNGKNEFTVTGRDGLPPSPTDILTPEQPLADLGTPINSTATQPTPTPTPPASPKPIVEAQGWIIDEQGNVTLVANVPTANSQGVWQPQVSCQGGR
jgi:filamentous hemagglutinin family protein